MDVQSLELQRPGLLSQCVWFDEFDGDVMSSEELDEYEQNFWGGHRPAEVSSALAPRAGSSDCSPDCGHGGHCFYDSVLLASPSAVQAALSAVKEPSMDTEDDAVAVNVLAASVPELVVDKAISEGDVTSSYDEANSSASCPYTASSDCSHGCGHRASASVPLAPSSAVHAAAAAALEPRTDVEVTAVTVVEHVASDAAPDVDKSATSDLLGQPVDCLSVFAHGVEEPVSLADDSVGAAEAVNVSDPVPDLRVIVELGEWDREELTFIEDAVFDETHADDLATFFGSCGLPHFVQLSGEPLAHRRLMCAAERVKRGLGKAGCRVSLLWVLHTFEARLAAEQAHPKATVAADATFSSVAAWRAASAGGG